MLYAEVMLRDDPVGRLPDGRIFLVPGALEWNPVEYREPEMCGCSIQGYLRDEGLVPTDGSRAANARADARRDELCEALGVDSCGSTMCRECRASWEIDHEVRVRI